MIYCLFCAIRNTFETFKKESLSYAHTHTNLFYIKRSFEPFREEQQEDKRYMNDLCKKW